MNEKQDKIIVVPNLPQDVAGAITFWRLSGAVSYEKLRAAWEEEGLEPKRLPNLPTPTVALHRAVMEWQGGRRLVRPLPNRSGWAIVHESTVGDENLDWNISIRVNLDALGRLVVEPAGTEESAKLSLDYNYFLNTLTLGDVSGWLSRIVYEMRATPLRDSGGVYFLPRDKMDEWMQIRAALRAASDCVIHPIPALRTAEAVESIIDAISLETESEARTMEEEITRLGGKGLQNRQARCEAIESKVAFYEELLGTKATELHTRLERLQASIAAAMLAGSGGDTDVDADIAGLG